MTSGFLLTHPAHRTGGRTAFRTTAETSTPKGVSPRKSRSSSFGRLTSSPQMSNLVPNSSPCCMHNKSLQMFHACPRSHDTVSFSWCLPHSFGRPHCTCDGACFGRKYSGWAAGPHHGWCPGLGFVALRWTTRCSESRWSSNSVVVKFRD